MAAPRIQKISVIVPENPFVRPELRGVKHCLAGLDVSKLMEWWPGKPHVPDRDAQRIKNIQRSLDWKRVAQIAAYLLQTEIIDAPKQLDECFNEIYEPKKYEPGRQWPPSVSRVIRFERSAFPTARGKREPIDQTERAQDLGRRLMLEIGPLVGMIQIPGIKYGVPDVVTLATLNSAIEDVVDNLSDADLTGIEEQAEFLALCLDAWLEASGRKEQVEGSGSLDPENVAYQGRVLVSFLTLVPACLWLLKKSDIVLISNKSKDYLIAWLKQLLGRAGLLERKRFIPKSSFKKLGYLGSGGIGRFRDTLWAASLTKKNITRLSVERKHKIAEENRSRVRRELASNE